MAEVVVVVVEDCSVETTGARSSMQKTSRRKDRGARTLCVTPASRHGENRTIWAEFYARFEGFEAKNVIGITVHTVKPVCIIRKSSIARVRRIPLQIHPRQLLGSSLTSAYMG